jgi:Band 3 cytoplasmic domain
LQPNKRLTKKLPKDCEAANILVGQVDFLSEVVMAFCRLETPSVMADLTEVAIPTRFVFVILGPKTAPDNAIWEYSELGRAMAALLNDKVIKSLIRRRTFSASHCVAGLNRRFIE